MKDGYFRGNARCQRNAQADPWCNRHDRRRLRDKKPRCQVPSEVEADRRDNSSRCDCWGRASKSTLIGKGFTSVKCPARIAVAEGPVNPALEGAINGLQKVVAVRLDVETDEVSSEQAFEQLRLPRAYAKCFRIRPRDVPEDGYTRIGPFLLDQLREQCEVVILHQDHGLGRPSISSRTASANF